MPALVFSFSNIFFDSSLSAQAFVMVSESTLGSKWLNGPVWQEGTAVDALGGFTEKMAPKC